MTVVPMWLSGAALRGLGEEREAAWGTSRNAGWLPAVSRWLSCRPGASPEAPMETLVYRGLVHGPRVGLEILARPSAASYQRPVSSLSPQCAALGNGASVQWGRGAVNTDRGLLCAKAH